MIYLIGFIITVFGAFIGYVWYHHGVQPSISASWYVLGKKRRLLFTFFLGAIGMALCIIAGLNVNVWYFLAGSCLCFTGGAAAYKKKITKTIHNIGAWGGIGYSFYGLVSNEYVGQFITFLAGVALIRIFKISNATWWIEVIAFECILFGLIKENLL